MAGGGNHTDTYPTTKYYKCCESQFFIYIVLITLLVLFAGLMSGLTLGLMSMSVVDLEVLAKSGTPKDRLHASKILPVVKRQHLLLCTLLISNAAAMEALPVLLDGLVPDLGAILISVTLILLFGEIIPQSICTRYGLVIGASVAPMVRVLVWICFPMAYPISKLLDFLLGNGHEPLYRRAELKTLVDFHSAEAGKGGDLSIEETTIIAGALELTEKTARDAMTPLSETFAIDINAKLDRDLIHLIIEKGHSRVPVYYEQPSNIIGLILVKNLLTHNPANEVPVKNFIVRRIPRVSETMPLYDILNEFQKGLSHMAAVVKQDSDTVEQRASRHTANDSMREVRVDIHSERFYHKKILKTKRLLKNLKNQPGNSDRVNSSSRRWSDHYHLEVQQINDNSLSTLTKDGEVIGIITMEDVIEELLKEEIYDETDH
ncbi:DUF21 domain-containing protein [Camellia lanceoleosa]|uniref:DUF21 domain-containing protein n=1 Tax=Camellia lanceoleosa TaxID=1840588 RepID=A0ACC0IZJ0_9ERIC|nr:DUF21 domain-containing protein [Camellia lanceoleosa]